MGWIKYPGKPNWALVKISWLNVQNVINEPTKKVDNYEEGIIDEKEEWIMKKEINKIKKHWEKKKKNKQSSVWKWIMKGLWND